MMAQAQRSAVLKSRGRRSWHETREDLAGYTVLWADPWGMHVGAAPENPPLSSHVWAWRSGAGVRLRMDGDTTIGAELQFVENTEPAEGASPGHEPAAIVEWTPEPRPTPDPEIAATIGELSGLSIVAVTTLDSSPMTFLLER